MLNYDFEELEDKKNASHHVFYAVFDDEQI